jgi:hypothetical protein
MNLPEAISELLTQFVHRFPIPQREDGEAPESHENRCRQWSVHFAQQVRHSNGDRYGVKKSGTHSPLSKDSLARATFNNVGDVIDLESWDLLLAVGDGKPVRSLDPQYHHIPNQIFVPVSGVNHLGASVPEPTPAPVPTPGTSAPIPGMTCKAIDAAAEVLDLLQEVRLEQAKSQDAILRALARLENDNRKPRPVSVGSKWMSLKGEVGGIDGL